MKRARPAVRAAAPEASATSPRIPFTRSTLAQLARLAQSSGWGFSKGELGHLQRHFRRRKRDPTEVELAGIAQSWSEHCSYKSSRPFLRAFRRTLSGGRVLGTGDAGVMQFADGWAYALRIESHNHPSAVEPYGGAATGIGGILRDVLAVGAEPIALADPLCFGPLDTKEDAVPPGVKHPRYLMAGVVAGIRDYGNRVGVPTVSGAVLFDPAYAVNPLVNVGCLGLLPRDRLLPNRAQKADSRLVLVGGFTGRDGIGGVAFASRELTERSERESRGAVQLGDPIMKEPLIRACVEAYDRRLVASVKDLGGGGLATASGELVHAGGFGSRIDLDRVPLREPDLRPWEIWISESQERMLLEVDPALLEELLSVFRKYDVPATEVGCVEPGGNERLFFRGEPVADLDLGFRVSPPLPVRRVRRPSGPAKGRPAAVDEPDLVRLVERLLLAPSSVSREPVLRVYDHEVQGRTVVKPLHGRPGAASHGDAAVLRARADRPEGIAVTVAANPWACALEPRRGAELIVEEAARNLVAVGARPDAFTNCLNFGNPEDPAILGAFAEVVSGLTAAATAIGFAVPSGNVSFYNAGLGAGIPPTPVLMATGLVDDVATCVTSDLKAVGDPLYLVGRSSSELGGSLYSRVYGVAPGPLPPTGAARVARDGGRLLRAIGKGTVRAAHDVSDGGLAVALPEMAFGGRLGFDVELGATGLREPAVALAAEGASRWIVEVPAAQVKAFERIVAPAPFVQIGAVAARRGAFRWKGRVRADLDLAALYEHWRIGVGIP